MKKELVQDYTARVSQCNRSQLVVVVYEIMIDYIKSARENLNNNDEAGFISDLKKAQNFLGSLMDSLNYKYPISNQLFNLYLFWNKQLSTAIIKKNQDSLEGIEEMIQKIRDSFKKVSDNDKSEPLMQNTQKVYAGLTYGRASLSEMADIDVNRGFQA